MPTTSPASTAPFAPFRLAPRFSERIWGRPSLAPWYASTGTSTLVGEAWLTGPDCLIETGELAGLTLAAAVAAHPTRILGAASTEQEFPLLVKMLFPNEKLSVQVHPDDAEAQRLGQPRGKTECWYVLEAEPGATVACGLLPGVTPAHLRAAAADGTMEQLLNHLPVHVGDMVFVDAGTVHAIGPGVVLLETQQTSDTTFRLFDYGRPRELHLDQGLAVVKPTTRAGLIPSVPHTGFTRLIAAQYFTVDRYDLTTPTNISAATPGCLICLSGQGTVANIPLAPGQALILPPSPSPAPITPHTPTFSLAHCFAP